MISIRIRLLVVWVLVVMIVTLAPFDFLSMAEIHAQPLGLFQYGAFERDPIHFLLNLLLFMPLGVLLHREGRHRSIELQQVVILTASAGLILSATVEFLQAFLPTRDSSLFDVIANTLGAVGGVAADRIWGVSVERWVHRVRARISL